MTYGEGQSGGGIADRILFEVEHDGVTARLDTSRPHTTARLVLADPEAVLADGERTAPGGGVVFVLAVLAGVAAAGAHSQRQA